MSVTEQWKLHEPQRREHLESIEGVFWRHDGNPNRPYARLRSGKISDGYFNGGKLSENPYELEQAISELVAELQGRPEIPEISRVIGPAMGAITLAHAAASETWSYQPSDVLCSYAEKEGDDFVFRRNPPQPGDCILLVEDTITTGGSIRKVRDAIKKIAPDAVILPFVLCLCNRSGKDSLEDMEIISYVTSVFATWNEGESPSTLDGKELVPPVEDVKQNWDLLTKEYP